MPDIFLSPSLQTGNKYINGGNEAQIMGYLADALEPYLIANGISYTRSSLPGTLAGAIASSNAGNYDLHLALHSNASPEGREGEFRGVQAYYYPTSVKGRQAADDLAEAMKAVYPEPSLVYTVPTTSIAEVRRTKAPAVLMEIGYHDNLQDAEWIKNNLQAIAGALAKGLTDYFELPFREVCTQTGGKLTESPTYMKNTYVRTCTDDGTPLNIRAQASTEAERLGQIPNGDKALFLGFAENGWARVRYNAVEGFSAARYLCTCNGRQVPSTGIVDTAGGSLNLRQSPSLNAPVLARIPDGTQIEILDSSSAWYRVRYIGVTGYVLGEFVLL